MKFTCADKTCFFTLSTAGTISDFGTPRRHGNKIAPRCWYKHLGTQLDKSRYPLLVCQFTRSIHEWTGDIFLRYYLDS